MPKLPKAKLPGTVRERIDRTAEALQNARDAAGTYATDLLRQAGGIAKALGEKAREEGGDKLRETAEDLRALSQRAAADAPGHARNAVEHLGKTDLSHWGEVLNGKGGTLPEDARERVNQTMIESGYALGKTALAPVAQLLAQLADRGADRLAPGIPEAAEVPQLPPPAEPSEQ